MPSGLRAALQVEMCVIGVCRIGWVGAACRAGALLPEVMGARGRLVPCSSSAAVVRR